MIYANAWAQQSKTSNYTKRGLKHIPQCYADSCIRRYSERDVR